VGNDEKSTGTSPSARYRSGDPKTDHSRRGALATIYRHLGSNLKIGVGYNFTDFSDV
jgi:hypothetical protein